MQILKLVPIFALLRMTYAKESRGACLLREAQQSLKEAPARADVAICYHGANSAYGSGETIKTVDLFGGLRWTECHGIGLDCFWMKGENIFQFYDDGGSDNIAVVYRNKNCQYSRNDKLVYCTSS